MLGRSLRHRGLLPYGSVYTEGYIMENVIDEAVALIAQARAIRSGMVAAGADVARIDEAIAHATGDVEYTRRRSMGYAA
jgi:hypothetical protein